MISKCGSLTKSVVSCRPSQLRVGPATRRSRNTFTATTASVPMPAAGCRKAYRLLFAEEGTMVERINDVTEMYKENQAVVDILDFIRTNSNRAICQPRNAIST